VPRRRFESTRAHRPLRAAVRLERIHCRPRRV
jgi:hypothetical protein